MIATERRRAPTVRACVKCGIEPRHADAYLGLECLVNGAYIEEKAAAEALPLDYRDRRRWLVTEKGWFGSW